MSVSLKNAACFINLLKHLVFVVLIAFLSACSTSTKVLKGDTPPQKLVDHLTSECDQSFPKELEGRLWLRIKTARRNVGLPATVLLKNNNANMLVSNPLGGTVASIQSDMDTLTVVSSSVKDLQVHKQKEWLGFSVYWMNQFMFLGYACPRNMKKKYLSYDTDLQVLYYEDDNHLWQYSWLEVDGQLKISKVMIKNTSNDHSVEYVVEDWTDDHHVRRAYIKSDESTVQWSWRSVSRK